MTPEKRAELEARMLDLARTSLSDMPRKPYITIETFAGQYRLRLWRTSRTRGAALLELTIPVRT